MIITFLGTSAANAYPEAFCRCDNCQRARVLGGPNLRKRSALLVNDDLLIDLGPDVMAASAIHRRLLIDVRCCLQTHAHADHLDPTHFLSRSPEYDVAGAPRLHFYASSGTIREASRVLERDLDGASLADPNVGQRLNLKVHQIGAMQTFAVGPYKVTAFPANHDPTVDPLLYAVESEGNRIFYGTDTAALSEEVWRAFHRLKLEFDIVILDHTYGPNEPAGDHLNAHGVIEHVARMREEGLLVDGGRAFATHISHPGNPVHDDLVGFAAQYGYEVAYDGLAVEVGDVGESH